ncbi:glycosyltransferase family 4 protein [Kluyvera ascorbata]|uniref:glycosyltransferase family 4 protein n=1 Tax=Kluyvera ascorbata TaxID=51288 RepID=UPI0034D4377C
MKTKYRKVFITNIPAFYKVNLFNEINDRVDIFVIFIAKKSRYRNEDFYGKNLRFDHVFLTNSFVEERSKSIILFKLINIITSLNFDEIVFSGWEIKESTVCSFLVAKNKNSIVIESSISETKTTGFPWFFKKMMLSRMSKAYPSGELQRNILNKANFKGEVRITHGVGISNVSKLDKHKIDKKKNEPIKFLYVGRLSKEKNVLSLVNAFSTLENELFIVGEGDEKNILEKKSSKNIHFVGYVDNNLLKSYYEYCDCFILPSYSEPWGLVVEEALTMGMPVIVSNKVGCREDLVTEQNGLIYDVDKLESLIAAIVSMSENYDHYRNGAMGFNVEDINNKQLNAYVSKC